MLQFSAGLKIPAERWEEANKKPSSKDKG